MTKYKSDNEVVQATQLTGRNLQYVLGLLSLDFDPPFTELERHAFENLEYRYALEGFPLNLPTGIKIIKVGQWIVVRDNGCHEIYDDSEFKLKYTRTR